MKQIKAKLTFLSAQWPPAVKIACRCLSAVPFGLSFITFAWGMVCLYGGPDAQIGSGISICCALLSFLCFAVCSGIFLGLWQMARIALLIWAFTFELLLGLWWLLCSISVIVAGSNSYGLEPLVIVQLFMLAALILGGYGIHHLLRRKKHGRQ